MGDSGSTRTGTQVAQAPARPTRKSVRVTALPKTLSCLAPKLLRIKGVIRSPRNLGVIRMKILTVISKSMEKSWSDKDENPCNDLKICGENLNLPVSEQALALAESQELVGHLTNENLTPTKYTTPDPTNTLNAENFIPKLIDNFIAWRNSGFLLCGWIIRILLEETLGLVVSLDTTHAVTYLRKEDYNTIGEHLRTFKRLCDSLATIRKTVLDKDKVFCLLTNLDPQYETFTTTKLKPPHHHTLNCNNAHNNLSQDTMATHSSSHPLDVDSKHNNQGTKIRISQITLLFPLNNVVLHRQNEEIPQALAAFTLDNAVFDIWWTSNTGASNHITSKSGTGNKTTDDKREMQGRSLCSLQLAGIDFSHRFKSGSAEIWHQRLRHP
ncbi:hypothetical protein Pint_25126 [Pistacia integerrima]|uniref:Uncharacterized protein n=1 Tax=Pistacia integerrima TaxID=434235 RepID=A0ACC0YD91_9ROSI|nr:hypothetical protein Pint_25126 [Pistacia integerrima]